MLSDSGDAMANESLGFVFEVCVFFEGSLYDTNPNNAPGFFVEISHKILSLFQHPNLIPKMGGI